MRGTRSRTALRGGKRLASWVGLFALALGLRGARCRDAFEHRDQSVQTSERGRAPRIANALRFAFNVEWH